MQTYVCTVGTVRSPFRILLVPECCATKLACTVADNSCFHTRPWVDRIISYKEQGRDLVFIM